MSLPWQIILVLVKENVLKVNGMIMENVSLVSLDVRIVMVHHVMYVMKL